MFFSFDGIDGVGKSVQQDLFCQWIRDSGYDVVTCRDPGSTQLGEKIRDILLNSTSTRIDFRSEMLLYMSARAQLVAEVIRPALEAGKVVVSDRYLLANVAYQGYGGKLQEQEIWQVGHVATAGIMPTLTFLLDMDVGQAMTRRNKDREPDRIEQRGFQFLDSVRQGFLKEAAQSPQEIVVVDAARSIEQVQATILEAAEKAIRLHNKDKSLR